MAQNIGGYGVGQRPVGALRQALCRGMQRQFQRVTPA
jgi:hypothetical protein